MDATEFVDHLESYDGITRPLVHHSGDTVACKVMKTASLNIHTMTHYTGWTLRSIERTNSGNDVVLYFVHK